MAMSNMQQQVIFRKQWGFATKKLYMDKISPKMLVVGKVIGSVQLRDIGKTIAHNQIVGFNEYEINKSKDLQVAIKMRWIEIVQNRSLLLTANSVPTTSETPQPTNDMTKDEILKIATEMARAMFQEFAQNDPRLRELKDEISSLKDHIGKDRVIVQTISDKAPIKIEDNSAKNMFIDIEDTKLDTNIQEIGTEKEEKEDLSASLDKMKTFRRKPRQ